MSAEKSELRERLERETHLGAGIGDGWWPAVEHAAWLLDHAFPGWESSQIKEKFGGLRFYITPAPYPEDGEANNEKFREEDRERWKREWYDAQEAIASAAESACRRVCEICGDEAEVVGTGWIHTLCPTHAEKYLQNKTMRGLKDA